MVGVWQVDGAVSTPVGPAKDISFVYRFTDLIDNAADPSVTGPSGWTFMPWPYATDGIGGTAVITVPENLASVASGATITLSGIKNTAALTMSPVRGEYALR